MKLIDLEPKWITYNHSDGVILCGVTFLCPHCRALRLGVCFDVPLDPTGLIKQLAATHGVAEWAPDAIRGMNDGRLWHRTGDTFDDLTLTPSIDCSRSGHWHGFITAGQVQ